MKRIMVITAILAALTLTGCSEKNELTGIINPVEAAGNDSSIVSTVSKVEEPAASTSEVENESSINVPEPAASTSTASSVESKPGEKPAASTSSAASSKVEKPVASASSTTSKPAEKPVVSSSAASTAEQSVHTHKFTNATCTEPATCITCGATKGDPRGHNFTKATCETPAICTVCGTTQGTVASHSYINGTCTNCGKKDPNYAAPHNCSTDGHVWNVTTITSEPKWCREMHHVYDYGFDATLAERYLNAQESTYKIFKNTLKKMGIDGACGSGSVEVEVWGTETSEIKECKECGLIIDSSAIHTINPIGEWQFVNGVNRRLQVSGINMNTLFYDPYNVPQVVIDNIILLNER